MFNITDFRSSINKQGVLKSNRYFVSFNIPPYLQDKYGQEEQKLMTLRCESVSIPGFDFLSADGPPRMGYGAIEKHPYVPGFTGLNLTFLIDSKSKIYNFFYDWTMAIVNYRGEGGTNFRNQNAAGRYPYEVGYKSKYQTDLEIRVYDGSMSQDSASVAGNEILKVKAFSAFPTGLPAVPMAWDSPEMMRLPVPFTYTDFIIDRNEPPAAKAPPAEPKQEPPPSSRQAPKPAAPAPGRAPRFVPGGGGFGGGGASGTWR